MNPIFKSLLGIFGKITLPLQVQRSRPFPCLYLEQILPILIRICNIYKHSGFCPIQWNEGKRRFDHNNQRTPKRVLVLVLVAYFLLFFADGSGFFLAGFSTTLDPEIKLVVGSKLFLVVCDVITGSYTFRSGGQVLNTFILYGQVRSEEDKNVPRTSK